MIIQQHLINNLKNVSMRYPVFPLFIMAALTLTGCVANSPKPQYYLLKPIAMPVESLDSSNRKTHLITLTAVHIPHYADRPQIVSASVDNRYQIDEFNRWAERLDDNIIRVLQQNLSILMPEAVILQNNSRSNSLEAVRLSVDILDFMANETGMAQLVAQWTITQDHQVLNTHQSSYHTQSGGNTHTAEVAALNELLNRLSRDLADDLNRMEKTASDQSRP